ncbi:S-layer homology domain-containing protein [Aneurinibacillus sp. REN35]|uniref:S-layer homology domain-containing protein n=1 Tax=Aneurinibacillus sp. REN35 TaxID=3237286 RepID=UPI0035294A29
MAKKSIVKVVTTAVLLSSLSLPVQAAPSFGDINNSFAKEAILQLVNQGIVSGKGNGKFDPTGNISRQDFAIILANALKLDVSSTPATATFSDIPKDHYAFAAVEAAAKAGLIYGTGGGKFGSGENLSRQDMAVIFIRALGIEVAGKGADLKFSDAASIANYAKDAVAAAVELGLLVGNNNGTFNPRGIATREQVAVVASKFLSEVQKGQQPSPTNPTQPTPSVPTQPTTPAPTTDRSDRGGGGGGGGGESSKDRTAPTVTLVSASPVDIGSSVIVTSNETGTVYLVPASENPSNKERLESLVLSNQAKKASVTAVHTSTSLTTEGLSAGNYKVYAVDASGNVSVPSSSIELRLLETGKASLLNKISEATSLQENSQLGNTTGKYPQNAFEALTQAITNAQSIVNNQQATSDEVNAAAAALQQAIIQFQQSVIAPLTFELQPNVRFDVNSNKLGPAGDVLITDIVPPMYQYNKQNIKNLVQIKRGTEIENIRYKPGTTSFEVINPSNEPVAEIALESSTDLVTLAPAPNGVNLHPHENVEESTSAAITFHLQEDGQEVRQLSLPITFDQTPPQITGGSYANNTFTLTASESITATPSQIPLVQIEGSVTGDFTDTILLYNGMDYTINVPTQDTLTINLLESGRNKVSVTTGSKFRITVSGYRDYADNSMVIPTIQIISVDQY